MEQAAANDPLIGVTIGNFEVKSKLGEGGMGSVYLAEHPLIGKKVAIKVLHQEFSSNEDMTRRFFVEAKAVADIGHPNIVDIVDYGYIPQGGHKTVYFIMEFLGGNSLAHVIRSSAPLPPERALAIALQIADALSTSHQHDIVHRDLKPDNVMLIQRGRETDFVKVLDFGIAKLTGDQQGSGRTRTGIVMGTPAYMSPEQCEGRGNIDHRTDIYALGILLYEMLTGQVPFKGEGYGEVLVKHLTQLPMRPSMIMPVIPPHVEAVVMKALEKHPQNRYPTMEEFVKALMDPVGYVEAHGGIAAFLSNTLTPSAPGVYQTPYQTQVPGNLMVPGSGAVMSPLVIPGSGAMQAGMYPSIPGVPGHATLGDDNGQVADDRGGGLHVGIIAAVAAVILVLGGGAFMLFGRGDDKPATDTLIAQPDGLPPGESPPVGANGDNPPAGDVVEPTPEPPVVPEVVEPEKVLIKVASRPEGASVYVADETEPRGVTPVSFELVKGAGEVPMILKLDGYKDEPRTLVPDRPREMDLSLRRDRSASRKSSDSSTKSTDTKSTDTKSTKSTDTKSTKSTKSTDTKSTKYTDTKSTKSGKVKNDVGLEEPEW